MALFCHSGVAEIEGTLGMELMPEVNPLMSARMQESANICNASSISIPHSYSDYILKGVQLFTEERNESFFRVPGIQFIGSRRSIVVCNVYERGKRYDGIFLPELNVERQIKAILNQTTPLLYKLLIGSNRQRHLFWINCGPVPFSLRLKVNQS
ncbi:hypothetical protein L1987_63435 [Smallanthus sonchifolius]|uniref:Uncharacterized protein n=1 Tax=Smallanthus sonchifolius TaxID=185202 RepID=A0ACB9CDA3_9ASTR|nr:hypothetical protein L1987_63435 [Smallanthus sonchifolius]